MSAADLVGFGFLLLFIWLLCLICYRRGQQSGIREGRLDEQAYIGRQNRQARKINTATRKTKI